MATAYQILVGSTGGQIDSFLLEALAQAGYVAHSATSVAAMSEALPHVDLLLLHIFAPQDLELVAQLRAIAPTVGVFVIGPTRAPQLLIGALEHGADDYVQRPFRTDELLARVRARLRRTTRELVILRLGPLWVDLRSHQATLAGTSLNLPPEAFLLLNTLAAQPGQPCRPLYLIDQVWGRHQLHDVSELDLVVDQLRQLIEENPARPRVLCGDQRQGYWITPIGR